MTGRLRPRAALARIAALDGTLDISSPPRAGTILRARLPIAGGS